MSLIYLKYARKKQISGPLLSISLSIVEWPFLTTVAADTNGVRSFAGRAGFFMKNFGKTFRHPSVALSIEAARYVSEAISWSRCLWFGF
jgi:hypothetical protein